MEMNIDSARSYATEATLLKALAKLGLDSARPLIVRNRAGRYTAVFGYAISEVHNPASIARQGFIVIN